MRLDHTSPRSSSENTIRPDAPRPDGMTPHQYAMSYKQFSDLTFTINIIQYSNMQLINKLFNSV